MDNTKIILNNGTAVNVNGIFYVFNSKYYFIYTTGELDENEYVKLYLVQVCKEVQNTPNGPVDTGYMLGLEITDSTEWKNVQSSITKIVDDKKNGTVSNEIQYLPINMLVNLKIVSANKFKLMKHIIEENFKLVLLSQNNTVGNVNEVVPNINVQSQPQAPLQPSVDGDVIIDYRAKFFEEQDKNQQLEEQIKGLEEKINNIKNIIG